MFYSFKLVIFASVIIGFCKSQSYLWESQTEPTNSQNWRSIASSSDGVKLAAVVEGGEWYTSYTLCIAK